MLIHFEHVVEVAHLGYQKGVGRMFHGGSEIVRSPRCLQRVHTNRSLLTTEVDVAQPTGNHLSSLVFQLRCDRVLEIEN